MFEIVDDDGRTPDHGYTISSPTSLRLRLAKNRATATQVTEQNLIQVAQRATIAHLTGSHQNILNSSQVKDFFNWSRGS